MSRAAFIDVGNPKAPVGSQAWCKAAHAVLCGNKRRTTSEVGRFKYGLIEFKKFDRWKQLTDDTGEPFMSWEDYLQYPEPNGLGMRPVSARRVMEANNHELISDVLAADALDRANQRSVGRPKKNLDNNKLNIQDKAPTGTSRAAALRRLRKDRPDIHKRVLAGEISPNAGMIEAGFRKARKSKKQTWLQKILKLLPKLTRSDLQQVQTWIKEHA